MSETNSVKAITIKRYDKYTPIIQPEYPHFKIIYVLEGQCTQNVGFENFFLKRGDIIVIAPETFHTIEVFDDNAIIFEINLHCDNFYEMFAPLIKGSHAVNKFLAEGLHGKSPMKYLLFHTAGDEFLRKNIFDILDEAARYDNFTEQHLIGCLILGFMYVIRQHSRKFRTNTSQALNLSDNFSIKSCLQKNLETITLRALANHLNLPVSNCSRLIKSSTGFNFSEWQKNLLEILGLGRRKKILEKLKQDHRVYVSELSKLFDVTEETIRRDLDKLEEEDLVKRDYGGAVLNSYISEDLSFWKRRLEKHYRTKSAQFN